MPTSPETTRRLIRRWNRQARFYDLMAAPMERMMGFPAARARLFERVVKGRVLEVGAGTGKNLAYYPQEGATVATDLSPGMLARAVEKAASHSGPVHFVVSDGEDLAFKAGSFDSVIASFVFCTVPDPVRGLREVRRVLREGGQVILLEHIRPRGLLGKLFDLLAPIASRLMGPHINRRTLENVRKAGLAVAEELDVFSDWIKLIVAR